MTTWLLAHRFVTADVNIREPTAFDKKHFHAKQQHRHTDQQQRTNKQLHDSQFFRKDNE